MSRSYRDSWATDGYKGSKRRQFFKRYSNKVVRRSKGIPDGGAFKKFSDPWNICDFKFYVGEKNEDEIWKYNRK